MEQLYMIEYMIDRVAIFATPENELSNAEKKLIIRLEFGPKYQFIIKEEQLAKNPKIQDDIIECDENGRRKWSRIFRVGKSFLFSSYPDTVLNILDKFPLDIEVWTDDEDEVPIFVGVGSMVWDREFFMMLKKSAEPCLLHEPLSLKQRTKLMDECCCKQVGEIDFILRISALGDSIITEFQQLLEDPENFVFRTNKAPSMFKCRRVEGDDPNFIMIGSLYETTTLEDPSLKNAKNNIEVCTELQSCGQTMDKDVRCQHEKRHRRKEPIQKIKMGDIRGPCGNANCALAHKVRCYLRNLESYKHKFGGIKETTKNKTNKVCGACYCKDDRYHREECPENVGVKTGCAGCRGVSLSGHTCKEQEDKLNSVGKPASGTRDDKDKNAAAVAYVFSVPTFGTPNGMDFSYYQDLVLDYESSSGSSGSSDIMLRTGRSCRCNAASVRRHGGADLYNSMSVPDMRSLSNKNSTYKRESNTQLVYNVNVTPDKLCLDIPDDKDCKCNPPKANPPCRTLDCECISEALNISARKKHKGYCPLYKHKSGCPVTRMKMKEADDNADEDEEASEPLPYGLPPIKLGPCPVMGRPCTVPDGFARMYKTAVMPPLPPSYSEAGKVCCSKEFERIKAAINEYIKKSDKQNDMRCVNTFNLDTERRCCDKEQILLTLMGKSCCGTHKLALLDKNKQEKK